MTDTPYGKRLQAAAQTDFRKCWSDYRWWLTIVGFFNLPIIVQLVHGENTLINWGLACLYALISLIFSLLGSYAIAMRRGAEVLDSQKNKTISDLTEQNSRLDELAHPKVPPEEKERRQQVRGMLKVCNFSKGAKAVLRTALDLGGEIRPGTAGLSPLGSKVYVEIAQQGVRSGLIVKENDVVFRIRPYLQAALRFLLDNEET